MTKFANLVRFTTATTGTGTITVGSATPPYRTPADAANLADGDPVSLFILDGTSFEHSTGVLGSSKTTVTRVLRESSTGSLLSLSGSAIVYFAPGRLDLPSLSETNAYSVGGRTIVVATDSIETNDTQLVLSQTGDLYGGTQLTLRNRSNENGAIFGNLTYDLVDFIFKGTTGQSNIRYERRVAEFLYSGNSWEFQFGTPAVVNAEYAFGNVAAYFRKPLILPASAAALAGLNLSPGTAPTSPANGDIWPTAEGLFARINGQTHGLVRLFKALTANAAYTNGTAAQPWFPSAGAVTVPASTTFRFRGRLLLTTGATSHTVGLSFGGTATLTSIAYAARGISAAINATATASNATMVTQASNTVVTAASTALGNMIEVEGVIRINAAGTLIPQFTFSAAPGAGNVLANTFFELQPIGDNTVVSNGTWA